jgi:aspartate aminotransferase
MFSEKDRRNHHMEFQISKAVSSMTSSLTLALSEKAAEMEAAGMDVCAFTAGEPDFDTPTAIRKVAAEAITKGGSACKYTAGTGMPELKKAVAKKFERENGLEYGVSQIIVSGGAKQVVAQAVFCLTDLETEVLICSPYWLSYPEMARAAGAKPVFIDCSGNENYAPRPEQLRAALTEKTRLLILNSPGNPTGGVITSEQYEGIYEVLSGTSVAVVSDEIYEHLVYDGKKHVSPASLGENAYNRTLTVNGASKGFAMTGWRIGYGGGPQEMMKALATLQSHYTSGPATVSQIAALAALEGGLDEVRRMREEFDKRRRLMVDGLNAIDAVSCSTPHGAFYCFPKVSGLYRENMTDSMDFSQALLEKEAVVVVPGAAFGADQYVRLSYACSTERIEKGIARIARFVNTLTA